MSNHFHEVSSCPPISEWINPHDERLVKITGLEPPVDARSLREDWVVERSELTGLLSSVKQLIVPDHLSQSVRTCFLANTFGGDNTTGIIALEFDEQTDWQECLPNNEKTLVFDRHGVRANASVAICGEVLGLAVIGMDFYEEEGLSFLIQHVRPEMLRQILAVS